MTYAAEVAGVVQRCGEHACGCPPQRRAAEAVRLGTRTGGHPLDAGFRRFAERSFGTDFSGVRVHDDAGAATAARSLGARAFTVGEHVVAGAPLSGPAGRRVLVHELTHVVQQRRTWSRPQGFPVSEPHGSDEREADAVADRVLRGGHAGPIGTADATVQRAVHGSVVTEPIRPNASACLVHLHGDERNAFETARSLYGSRCANFVHLDTTTRHVPVDGLPSGRRGTFDPNRVFTASGLADNAFRSAGAPDVGVPTARRAAAATQVTPWAAGLKGAISRCRLGGGTEVTDGRIPVVAFHNNTPNGGLSIASYRAGGSESGATETDATILGGAANPARQPATTPVRGDPDNFVLLTDPRRRAAFAARFNTVLQAHDVDTRHHPSGESADDGSLSVALRGGDYVNVEAQVKPFRGATNRFFVENLAMGNEVLDIMGVPTECPAPKTAVPDGVPEAAPVQRQQDPGAGAGVDSEADESELALQQVIRLLERMLRAVESLLAQPTALPREAPPATLPRGCRTFADQTALDARKAVFAGIVAAMPVAEVVKWIIGVKRPPKAVTDEMTLQLDCLKRGLAASAGTPGSPITHDPFRVIGSGTPPGFRSFADQERIWRRKFAFTGGKFDRISAVAALRCGLPVGAQWDPGDTTHQTCWSGLSADEKQQEILTASSAPGISRHHWGTDVDIFSTEPADWQRAGSGTFGDEYAWLRRNASTYGFLQSFTATSGLLGGYMEERWHWSYYPAAQALLEFARANQARIDTALRARWTGPEFSFIRANWRDFVFNVSETPRF